MGTKELVATYQMIRSFHAQPSNKWLALSEFIDNAISSWQGKGNENHPIDGLKIEILFDSENLNNAKIIIVDNAKGMSEEELLDAMQPHNRKGKQDNHYNQYGVGMKFGCFWFGKDATVYSKVKGGQEYYVELKTSNIDLGRSVFIETKPSYENKIKTESGTYIVIENVYENRVVNTDADYASIREALGWRYSKLLDGGLSIRLRALSRDKKMRRRDEGVMPFHNNAYVFSEFLNQKKKEIENLDVFKNKMINEIEDLKQKSLNSGNKILYEFCEKMLNNEPLFTREKVLINNKETFFEFGILTPKERNYQKRSGVTTYHIKRAINHGPNTSLSSTISFAYEKNKGSGGESHWRRLFGEIDLTNIEVPDQNKSRFDWSVTGWEDLKKILSNCWNSLSDLLELMIRFEKEKQTSLIDTSAEVKEIIKSQSSIIDVEKIKMNIDSIESNDFKRSAILYEIKGCNKKIRVTETNLHTDNFLNISHDEKDFINVTININSPIWKPFIDDNKTNTIFRGKSVYSIILIMVICNEYVKSVKVNKENELINSLITNKCDELYEVINDVLNKIQVKNE